jgi:hypothetical protein
MKKLKIRKETLLPLDHRFPLHEAIGGITTIVVHQEANTSVVHI